MGLYRAALNIPGLRFGKTATMRDDDPVVIRWVASGALVRLDGPPVEVKKVEVPSAGDADGDIVFGDERPDDQIPEVAPAPVVAPKPAAAKATRGPKAAKRKPEETPIERKAPEASSVNPDLGIRFDDEDD